VISTFEQLKTVLASDRSAIEIGKGMLVTYQNDIHDEMKNRLKPLNECHHSVYTLSFYLLVSFLKM